MLKTASPKRLEGIEDLATPAQIAKVAPLDLTSRRIFSGKLKGERRSKKRGESVEFALQFGKNLGDGGGRAGAGGDEGEGGETQRTPNTCSS